MCAHCGQNYEIFVQNRTFEYPPFLKYGLVEVLQLCKMSQTEVGKMSTKISSNLMFCGVEQHGTRHFYP